MKQFWLLGLLISLTACGTSLPEAPPPVGG